MAHAGIKLTKEQWRQYFEDEKAASNKLQELKATEIKLYKVNDLVIKTYSEYLVSGMERVGKQYTIQLIQNYGKEDAEILMNERIIDDKEKANEAFKKFVSLAF